MRNAVPRPGTTTWCPACVAGVPVGAGGGCSPMLLALVLVLLLAVGGVVAYLTSSIGGGIARIPDAFRGIDAGSRPATSGGTTFLLVGTDSRAEAPTTGTDAAPGSTPVPSGPT